MKKTLFLGLIIFLISCSKVGFEGGKCLGGGKCAENNLICSVSGSCESCGQADQMCCKGNLCNENTTCGSNNICEFCGEEGEACCKDSCRSLYNVCSSQGICAPCGNIDEPCCEGEDFQGCEFGTCNIDHTCQTEICDDKGKCTGCGNKDQTCCKGETCGTGFVCGESNICKSCGKPMVPACADGKCDGWWQNINGVCENPFKDNPNTDLLICKQADPGQKKTQQDSCFWYAAFYTKDKTICEMIQWEKMKILCQKMENPNNYNIIAW